MKPIAGRLWWAVVAALLLASCGRPEKFAPREMEQAFGLNTPAPASPQAAGPALDGDVTSDVAPGGETDIRRLAQRSLVAMQNRNYSLAVTNLESLQQERTLTPGQRLAVHRAIESAQRELALAISRGDAEAKRQADRLRQSARH